MFRVIESVTEYTLDDIVDGDIDAEADEIVHEWQWSDGDPCSWAAAIIDAGAPGPVEPSCWPYAPGSWFGSSQESMGLHGEFEDRSWHLEGFTPDGERAIWDIVRGARRPLDIGV